MAQSGKESKDLAQRKASPQQNFAPRGMGYRIKVLALLITRIMTERLEPYGLTPFHWLVLNLLWREDGLAVSTIGDKLQQVGGTMTGVLDRMEERGFILRERDAEDRRIWRTWLTTKGRELQKVLPPVTARGREELLQGISGEQYEVFMDVLERLIGNSNQILEGFAKKKSEQTRNSR